MALGGVDVGMGAMQVLRECRDYVDCMRTEVLTSHMNPRTGKPEPADVADYEDALLIRIDAALGKVKKEIRHE
jgi:hypothetical protein